MARDWHDHRYLLAGTARQQAAYTALQSLEIFEVLNDFRPVLIGTIPLDIDTETSDLDVSLHAPDLQDAAALVRQHYGGLRNYHDHFKQRPLGQSFVANFEAQGFPVELFAMMLPSAQQHGYRHMVIEHRLLTLAGHAARDAIRRLKQDGLKTEPAFAQYFGLDGDPYAALLALETEPDAALHAIIQHSQSQ